MNKKHLYFLVVSMVLLCAFTVQAAKFKTPKQLVSEARAAIKQVSVEDLETMVDNDEKVIILDIRDPHEYEKDHISGAIHMSRGLVDLHAWEILPDKNAKIVVY